MSTVLLVDDMAIFREPIAAALRQEGYDTVCAADGSEALRLVREYPIDVALVDVGMPVMDGLTMLQNLRRDPAYKELPVLMLSALSDRDTIVAAGKLGVRGYMLKSRFSLADLFARIKACLDPAVTEAAAGAPSPAAAQAGVSAASAEATARPATVAVDATPVKPAAVPTGQPVRLSQVGSYTQLKDLKPIIARSQIDEFVQDTGELKAMSPTVGQLMKLTGSADGSIDRVAKAIQRDQAIALKVLKIANSTIYGRGETVESVLQAVMRIGLTEIRHVVMSISVIERFSDEAVGEHLTAPMFWEHAISTGLIAAALTRYRGGKETDIDAAFTTGLLHDVGRMVCAEEIPEAYVQVLEVAARLKLPVEVVESRLILVDHAELTDKLLRIWHFPKHLIDPIALHHSSLADIRTLAPQNATEVLTLALANHVSLAMGLGSSGNNVIYPIDGYIQALKVRPDDLSRIEEEIGSETADMKLSMLQASSESQWPGIAEQLSSQFAGRPHPVFVGVDPVTDAYRMFVDHCLPPVTDKPNIAVVHIPNVRQRDEVSQALAELESSLGIANLPLIVISPKGSIGVSDEQMAERSAVLLESPTPVARLVDAIDKLVPA